MAEECGAFLKSHPRNQTWECRLSHNQGQGHVERAGCFTNETEGMAWLERESGNADGRIELAECQNKNDIVRMGQLEK